MAEYCFHQKNHNNTPYLVHTFGTFCSQGTELKFFFNVVEMKTEDFEKHLICLLWLFCFSFDDPYFSGSGVSPEIFHHNDGWQGGEIIR